MTQPLPPPPIDPFTRLQVSDGLLVNAEHWRRAHAYHRLRQNLHYQSLQQPGIVCGLGVCVIPAPEDVPTEVRDQRWVQVQPGIAIDLAGNPIVLPEAVSYRLVTETKKETVTVYLTVSYVDPDELNRSDGQEWVQETYRIDERTSPPNAHEVEVARILLKGGPVQIRQPVDAFFPGYGDLDLRWRVVARQRPTAQVRVAQVVLGDDPEYARNFFNLGSLLRALDGLYPSLQSVGEVFEVTLEPEDEDEWEADAFDLLYLSGRQRLNLNNREFGALKDYLKGGGVLLVDAPPDATALIDSIGALGVQLGTPLEPLEKLRRDHPLRNRPFLFAALPVVNQQPVRLQYGGGIVLVVGDLAAAWGLDEGMSLSRLALRTAQELGINLLYFAWCRRQLMGLQRSGG
jgi:hypothetical protein